MPHKKNDPQDKETEINIIDSLKKLKINYVLILLLIILSYGFYLRFYHIDYPVIGYHNWKTAHYISEAKNFERDGFFKHGFFVPMRDTTESINEPADGEHNDTFPTISIVVGVLFKLFGESLLIARLAEIFFSLGAVVFLYLLVKALFEKESLALIAAFLGAVNPLLVFFSHNIDVINPGIFFMLAGAYFYVAWVKNDLGKDKYLRLYLSTFLVMMAVITKYTFIVIAAPILISFPYKKFFSKKTKIIVPILICLFLASGFPAWFYYSEIYVKEKIFQRTITSNLLDSYEISRVFDLSIIWSKEFWAIMSSYVADNFTMLGAFFSILGSMLFFFFYIMNSKNDAMKKIGLPVLALGTLGYFLVLGFSMVTGLSGLAVGFIYLFFMSIALLILSVYTSIIAAIHGKEFEPSFSYQFMLGYIFGLVAFVLVMGFKLSGHNYHQFPVAPIIIFLISYLFEVVAKNIAMFIPNDDMKKIAAVIVIAVLFIVPFSEGKNLLQHSGDSADRMFDTQFPGLDIAGDYIDQHAGANERFFHSSGQSFGVVWHAKRRGYKPPSTVEYLTRAEKDYNTTFIFMYQWGLQTYFQNKEVMDYIRGNYRLVEFAYVPSGAQAQPLFMLFRKGGSFNESSLSSMVQAKAASNQLYKRTYHYSKNRVQDVMYVDLE
jgi:hypothetical protein